MADPFYTRSRIECVVIIAKEAARAHQRGEKTITLGVPPTAQKFDLRKGGMCNCFLRQCFEVACGIGEQQWRYRAGRAKWTLEKLDKAGHAIWKDLTPITSPPATMLLPGDIIGKRWGTYGHVMLYVGQVDGRPMMAENTSCGERGNPERPGTKLTRYQDCRKNITGVYRLLDVSPRKPDVAPWAEPAVNRAVQLGLMSRDTNGLFRGYDAVTRQELAEVAVRLIKRDT